MLKITTQVLFFAKKKNPSALKTESGENVTRKKKYLEVNPALTERPVFPRERDTETCGNTGRGLFLLKTKHLIS